MKSGPARPLAIDLFCGLGGWTEGLLAEGYRVVGFDIEIHDYGDGKRYPSQLVLQDVLTIHGRQFKDAALIVASPPCQEFSYMAMPWSRAKAIAAEYRSGVRDTKKLTALFDACFRIQREAIAAAGHHIPMVVENVRGAQPWVGRARWNFGSYYLWGDVPALMPITIPRARMKQGVAHWPNGESNFHGIKAGDRNLARSNGGHKWTTSFDESLKLASESGRRTDIGKGARFTSRDCGIENENNTNVVGQSAMASVVDEAMPLPQLSPQDGPSCGGLPERPSDGFKTTGMNWSDRSKHGQDFTRIAGQQAEGVKQHGSGREWFAGEGTISRMTSSKSNARKAASATIAKIPLPLARWIGKVYRPTTQ